MSKITKIAVSKLRTSKTNPRTTFDTSDLRELGKSIKASGLVQPIVVRKIKGGHEIVVGERRYRAAKLVKVPKLDCVVRDLTDDQVVEFQIIENVQRKDVSALEEAVGYKKLIDAKRYTVESLAKKIGKSPEHVYTRLRLNNLEKSVAKELKAGTMTAGHAIILARLDEKTQVRLVRRVVEKDWRGQVRLASVRDTLEIVKDDEQEKRRRKRDAEDRKKHQKAAKKNAKKNSAAEAKRKAKSEAAGVKAEQERKIGDELEGLVAEKIRDLLIQGADLPWVRQIADLLHTFARDGDAYEVFEKIGPAGRPKAYPAKLMQKWIQKASRSQLYQVIAAAIASERVSDWRYGHDQCRQAAKEFKIKLEPLEKRAAELVAVADAKEAKEIVAAEKKAARAKSAKKRKANKK